MKSFEQLSPVGQDIAAGIAALPPEGGEFTNEKHAVGLEREELVAKVMFQGCNNDAYGFPSCIDCARFASGRKLCEDIITVKRQIVTDLVDRLELIDMSLPSVFMADDIRRTTEQAVMLASTAFGQAVYEEVTAERPDETEV